MKCFFHKDEDARCICKKCGKGMCIPCSASGQHSGLCPACMLSVYHKRLAWSIVTLVLVPLITLFLYLFGVWHLLIELRTGFWMALVVVALLSVLITGIVGTATSASTIRLVNNALKQKK